MIKDKQQTNEMAMKEVRPVDRGYDDDEMRVDQIREELATALTAATGSIHVPIFRRLAVHLRWSVLGEIRNGGRSLSEESDTNYPVPGVVWGGIVFLIGLLGTMFVGKVIYGSIFWPIDRVADGLGLAGTIIGLTLVLLGVSIAAGPGYNPRSGVGSFIRSVGYRERRQGIVALRIICRNGIIRTYFGGAGTAGREWQKTQPTTERVSVMSRSDDADARDTQAALVATSPDTFEDGDQRAVLELGPDDPDVVGFRTINLNPSRCYSSVGLAKTTACYDQNYRWLEQLIDFLDETADTVDLVIEHRVVPAVDFGPKLKSGQRRTDTWTEKPMAGSAFSGGPSADQKQSKPRTRIDAIAQAPRGESAVKLLPVIIAKGPKSHVKKTLDHLEKRYRPFVPGGSTLASSGSILEPGDDAPTLLESQTVPVSTPLRSLLPRGKGYAQRLCLTKRELAVMMPVPPLTETTRGALLTSTPGDDGWATGPENTTHLSGEIDEADDSPHGSTASYNTDAERSWEDQPGGNR